MLTVRDVDAFANDRRKKLRPTTGSLRVAAALQNPNLCSGFGDCTVVRRREQNDIVTYGYVRISVVSLSCLREVGEGKKEARAVQQGCFEADREISSGRSIPEVGMWAF